MSEPTLEAISDYDTLKGKKKRVIWVVILAALIIGGIYVTSYNYFDNVSDSLPIEKKIGTVPVQ
jgi:SNF family Na+-dependent transporter